MNTVLLVSALAILVAGSQAYRGGFDYDYNDGPRAYGNIDTRGRAAAAAADLRHPVCYGPCDTELQGTDCINACPDWGVCIRHYWPFINKCCCFPLPNAYERCTVKTDCDAQNLYCPGKLTLECNYVNAFTRSVCACVDQTMDGYIEVQRPLKTNLRNAHY